MVGFTNMVCLEPNLVLDPWQALAYKALLQSKELLCLKT